MIINYATISIKLIEKISATIGEPVFIRGSPENYSIFSETPFVLLFDYKKMKDKSFWQAFGKEKFMGSKILYCLYLTDKEHKKITDYATKMARLHDFVLFGNDYLTITDDNDFTYESENKLTSVATNINYCCPFKKIQSISFPFIDKNQ